MATGKTQTGTLSRRFGPLFAPGLKDRAVEYVGNGRIHDLDWGDDFVSGKVHGSAVYDTSAQFSLRDGRFDCECTCPYFEDHTVCKHVYAVLMEADRRRLFDESAHSAKRRPPEKDKARPAAKWRRALDELRDYFGGETPILSTLPADRQIVYRLTLPGTENVPFRGGGDPLFDVCTSRRGSTLTDVRQLRDLRQWMQSPDAADAELAHLVAGIRGADRLDEFFSPTFAVVPDSFDVVVRKLCDTGRAVWREDEATKNHYPLRWDDGTPWRLRLVVRRTSDDAVTLDARLEREAADGTFEALEPKGVRHVFGDRYVLAHGSIARLESFGCAGLIRALPDQEAISVPNEHVERLVEELATMPSLPPLELPPELEIKTETVSPKPRLLISSRPKARRGEELLGKLRFEYSGQVVDDAQRTAGFYNPDARTLLLRHDHAERDAVDRLARLGFTSRPELQPGEHVAPAARLGELIEHLVRDGWTIELEGKPVRRFRGANVRVASGIDWFDVTGKLDFDGAGVGLPELLKALQNAGGSNVITLEDGTVGIVPEEWVRRVIGLADLSEVTEDALRFGKTQAMILDALLATMPLDVNVDAAFEQARKELARFDGVETAEPPETFTGTLRPYQKLGLGWLQFLQRIGFGGCLADDMGLGKTIQVLAMLDQRRLAGGGPSLVVVPRSLVHNWMAEAAKFTPNLRVLDQSGPLRLRSTEHLRDYDLVLSTYGTLRTDAEYFTDFTFDYAILDEAQAIKNPQSASAKAARLLRARHKLVMTGTPIENHLGDIWSLFEYLNPGMLGRRGAFAEMGMARTADSSGRTMIAQALRPFILRRVKQQVAEDLPERTEQVLVCELDENQRKLYDELREHYRTELLAGTNGHWQQNKMNVLEALLRLRQASCHPGLIDPTRAGESSSKLDLLLERLEESIQEGHKALVFSQFVSLLQIVKRKLDDRGMVYEYLDGETRNRAERVQRFQTDDNCKLFLISLKAGGVGLNLTAADYVFILDPWWNPAVEAQAIDRTHRIGQTRPVFAYRLIAANTVEEKVVSLQQSKRELAEAIVNADNSLLRNLTRDELENLLS
jgi:hypothetical protein